MHSYVLWGTLTVVAVGLTIVGARGGFGTGRGAAPEPGDASASTVGTPALSPTLDAVKDLRVFFGHQSVGNNILDGVRELAPDLRTVRSEKPPSTPMIAESLIGRNGDPDSKLSHFARVMQAMGDQVDVAILKFCYVDFSAGTNVEALGSRYRESWSNLEAAHPHTFFVHVTVPLTIVQTGPKAMVKRLLGRPVWGELENQKRAQFNDWLRRSYKPESIFDLAAIESRSPDGKPVTFEFEGRRYPMLYAPYSDDGQHLAGEGRRAAGTAFLNLLERLGKERVR